MFGKLLSWVRTRPGLCILILFLFFISIATLKPDFYLLGWDNYSSYLNLKINIGRTLFSTWRAYRGLGVPSDSEATDLFRQVFLLFLSPFVNKPSLDQIYLILSLNGGAILMYFFSRSFLSDLFKNKLNETKLDFFSAASSFFYLFNLNTLSTFYFPMIMYINRFYTLPLLGLVFLHLLKQNAISLKKYLLIFLALLFSSGSYLTPTIFVTFIIFLMIFGIFSEKKRRFFTVFFFFICVNAFWLFPFANYTLQRAKIIRLAPTFIDANEAQLNKPKSFYSLSKNLILYPNFFDTEITNAETGQKEFFHPLANSYKEFPDNAVLFLFPGLYILGSYLIFRKHERRFFWVPITILFFLFLTLKEYSALGFLYVLFKHITPYFDVLFRFGDTKFHPFLAFAGSIAAAVALYYLIIFFAGRKLLFSIIAVGIVASTLYTYRSYFSGNLVGYFMYNKIPDAYFKIAEIINRDTDSVRVLHLPVDRDQYWRSYSWGMVGSSFFHFLIDKPYIDKTFDPGSEENANLNQEIYKVIQNSQESDNALFREAKANEFLTLLKKNNIRYIIFDETVGAEALAHKKILWGRFNTEDTRSLLSALSKDAVEEITRIEVDNSRAVILYRVRNVGKKIEFASTGIYIEPQLKKLPSSLLSSSSDVFIQDTKSKGRIYPFLRNDTQTITPGEYMIQATSSFSYKQILVTVSAKRQGNSYVISFYQQFFPEINGKILSEKIKETRIDNVASEHLKLAVGKEIIDVSSGENQSLIVEPGRYDIRLLTESGSKKIDPNVIKPTDNPNCFQDRVGEFGSNCFHADLSPYIFRSTENVDIWLQTQASSQDFDRNYLSKIKLDSAKPGLTQFIQELPKPNVVEVCLKEYSIDTCLNNYSVLDLSKATIITASPTELLRGKTNLELFLALKNTGYQKQSLYFKEATVTTYEGRLIDILAIPEKHTAPIDSRITLGDTLTMKIPVNSSKYSFQFNPDKDAFYFSNSPCAGNSYRTVRKLDNSYLFFVNACDNVVFQTLPFSSNNFYLWSLDYNLFTGRFPKYILEDDFYHYLNSYLSVGQGYPDIPGFKIFEDPEWFGTNTRDGQKITTVPFITASQFIEPHPVAVDVRSKNFTLQNYSENEGGYLLSSYMVNQIPNSWYSMYLKPENDEKTYNLPKHYSFKQLLPSLWKINIVPNEETGRLLLIFNEGYDSQWIAVGGIKQMRCNGSVNCYEIPGGRKTVYLFYAPEILSFLGWAVTVLAFFLFKNAFVVKNSRRVAP